MRYGLPRLTQALAAVGCALVLQPDDALAHEPVQLRTLTFDEQLSFFGLGSQGFLRTGELDLLSRLLRCRRTGRTRRVHPRLAQLLVRVGRHFGRPVVVHSGYRARVLDGRRRSLHLTGMAADVSVEGVSAEALRSFAHAAGVTGIGYYPTSGFVHLDVRERRYAWVDYSGPGERGRLVPDPDGTAPPTPSASAVARDGRVRTDRRASR